MKVFKHIALLFTLFLLASCAMDEMFDGLGPSDGEEVVMTFTPRFEDFETVTKAIGDGTQVDKLLVQVYEGDNLVYSDEYAKNKWSEIDVPFYYGKTYHVYFWAYNSESSAYIIGDGGIRKGVIVNYPESVEALSYADLEYLDAFYAVETINLSDNEPDNTSPSLTRPFAQVNLVADKAELLNAKATKVEFTINAADSFVPGAENAISTQGRKFVFTDDDFFQNNEEISTGKVYLGTTYLFVPSAGSLDATVTLYDSMGNKLKGPTTVSITLATNQRTNLVFTGVEPAWDDEAVEVPGVDTSDGWIHIETAEQLAAFLIGGTTSETKVHICNDINMGGMPARYHDAIAAASFSGLILHGGALENGEKVVGGGSSMISNLNAPAFLANATNLTVSNLTLDNCNVTYKGDSETQVGVLVNTLKGSSSFTNVTVSNSSATTANGAAGGMVGYVERIAPITRSEELTVTFTNCHVNGAADKHVAAGSGAEGKFVGLLNGYDYGEILIFDAECSADVNATVADYMSRYTEGNEGEWLETNDYTSYNGFLGEETYNRGTIIFGANQFIPMWDGIKQVSPMNADSPYDGWSSGKVIYSAFDLASLQGLKSTSGNYYLCADVDLGGDGKDGQVGKLDKDRNMQECGADDALFKSINYIANFNGVKKDKIGASQASLTESDNYSIYNCKVVLNKHDGYGAGFIKQVTGTTNHSNINLVRAYVYNHHDETLPEQKYYEDDNGSGNAYAGTFVSSAGGTYNISNVHVSYGHVMAVCKIGGIIGRATGVLNMTNCSVHNHTVENWKANIINWYPMAMPVSDWMVYINQSWYTQGECGGLIGFIKSMSALIDNCSVTDTDINCYGQPDKQVTAGVYMSGWTSIEAAGANPKGNMSGYTIIAGRHVNQFIGDVVSERAESRATSSDYTVTIKDYYVAGNRYFGTPVTNAGSVKLSESTNKNVPRTISYNPNPTSHAYGFSTTQRTVNSGWWSTTYYTNTVDSFCDCVGSAYYVGVDVKISFIITIEKHVRHCAGTLIFNEKGKSEVKVTEAIKDGNNIAWTGGDFWM